MISALYYLFLVLLCTLFMILSAVALVLCAPFVVIGKSLLIASIPLFCIANAWLKKAAEGYSPRTAYVPQLSLGAQPSGIGLGIRF